MTKDDFELEPTTQTKLELLNMRQSFSDLRLNKFEAAIERRLDRQDIQLGNLDEKIDKLLLEVASAHAETKRSRPPTSRTSIDAKTTAGITAAVSGSLLALAEVIKAIVNK